MRRTTNDDPRYDSYRTLIIMRRSPLAVAIAFVIFQEMKYKTKIAKPTIYNYKNIDNVGLEKCPPAV